MALFGKSRRKAEIADELRAQLTPRDQLELDPPDEDFAVALAGAASGDAGPVGTYLADLRQARSWELRSRALDRISSDAVEFPLWVTKWAQAQPEDPDAQLLNAALLIRLAWEARTKHSTENVEHWRFREFHDQLEAATPQLHRAIEVNPGDPEPWRLAMQHATGLEAPEEDFRDHLGNAQQADPWHYQSNEQAVNRLSAKWGGSHEVAFDFAEQLAAAAPGDRAVHILPLRAGYEMWIEDEAAKKPMRPRVEKALTTAQAYADRFPDGAREAAEARSMLGFMYAMLDRPQESFDAFKATGGNVSAMPWEYNIPPGKDDIDRFATFRDDVVVRLADASA